MPRPLDTVTLAGDHVRLEPLSREHIDGLVRAASVDRSTYDLSPVPAGTAATTEYVEQLLADHAAARALPFCQIAVATEEPVGCTRLLDLQWWRDRVEPDEVEIGGTWLAATAQRTGINTEAKFLLLRHAFERLGVWRVAICTDARNDRSRAAIERIGASFEGVLRNHRLVADSEVPRPRQTAVYSIIDDEWAGVSARLRAKLVR